jgi:hypothetical protein
MVDKKERQSLVKVAECPHVTLTEPANTGVIVEWEEKGENLIQLQYK